MTEEEESKRVSVQVSSLSTQLIQSIDRQSHLEEQLLQARKVINGQKESLEALKSLENQVKRLQRDVEAEKAYNAKNLSILQAEKQAKELAQAESDRLNKEVEDLTASLFDEANAMVSDARKETYSYQVKNSKLNEQLQEKDSLLDTLEIQLKNLKAVLYSLEDESITVAKSSRNSIAANENATLSSGSLDNTMNALNGTLSAPNTALFSPYLNSLRYDLRLFHEFLTFVAVLPQCSSIKETSSHSKLLRRLINDEIQPMLRLDNASGVGWYVRRNLMTLMIEGMVVVEPVSGINETYRVGHSTNQGNSSPQISKPDKARDSHLYNYPLDSPPVAIQDPCAFCSESRNDILEHGRLYVLKTLQKNEDGELETSAQFPLCHYCLLKIRQTCEIFAFLRLLRSGAWHLEDVALSDVSKDAATTQTSAFVPESAKLEKRSKRMSFMAGLSKSLPSKGTNASGKVPIFSAQGSTPVTNIQRAWAQLCKLRASLHWAHIGVWSLEDSLETKLGPVVIDSMGEQQPASPQERLLTASGQTQDSFTIHKEEHADSDKEFDFEQMAKSNLKSETSPQKLESKANDQNNKQESHTEEEDVGREKKMSSDQGSSTKKASNEVLTETNAQDMDELSTTASKGALNINLNGQEIKSESVATVEPSSIDESSSQEKGPSKSTNAPSVDPKYQAERSNDSVNKKDTHALESSTDSEFKTSSVANRSQSATDDEESAFDDARSNLS
ncbi:LANO_0G02190g1_1 [Lachancea nothofagi CBS 11611]|uniref:LANO_0G02190g1_1 n=1 Tax=Lachancea nothofagi CBS 11611 TaxID=1266666 RepID=A0A1G4KF38_9SACH|nr:LANO_0G02190g1_1 [Lachancea nothofagi CBS 11611]